ncbi:MAG: type I methionyl aminopeptidase [Fidelibacterota bacterium]
MIRYKSQHEIQIMRKAGKLVHDTLVEVSKWIKPGISTAKLDAIAEDYIRSHHGLPGFKGYNGYPATLCVSVNEEVVHGIPGPRILKEGDMVSIDCGTIVDGYYGDHARTFSVGELPEDWKRLMTVTEECLNIGIRKAVSGNHLLDIGYAIQTHAEGHHFSVIRSLVGHGIGRKLHEEPQVPNYGHPGRGMRLKPGLVIAIEPMINLGTHEVETLQDGWTIVTRDRKVSAHFEHTIAVTENEPLILTNG